MHSVTRGRLLAGAALGLGLTMIAAQPAYADSVCAPGGTPVLTPPVISVACTDVNGNGQSEANGTVGFGVSFVSPTAVLDWFGSPQAAITTGYIESTTAGRGVLNFVTDQPFTYVGTGSTLVGQATATGAVTLGFTGPSVTLNTGTLTALGAGSTALSVTTTGGAGSGGIGVTVDGDVLSAGPGIVLNQSNAAATGNVSLTSTAGNTITSNAGTAVDINTAGTGTIAVITGDDVIADAGTAIDISATNAAAGAISVTHNDVVRASAGDGIVINTAGSGTVTVNSNDGILSAGGGAGTLQDGIVVTSTGTGNIAVNHTAGAIGASADLAQGTGILATINNAASAGTVSVTNASGINSVGTGIDASTSGTGAVSVTSTGGQITSTAGDGIAASTTTGALTVNAGAISAGAVGIYATTTDGALSVTQTGALTSADIGIDVQASGTGAVTINRTGAGVLTSTGSTGIQANTTTGALTITTGAISAAAGDGVDATSTTGAIIVNVTGAVSGGASDGVSATSTSGGITVNVTGGNVTGVDDAVQASTTGATIVNVSAGRTLSGNYGVYTLDGGTLVVNNSGTITGTNSAILTEDTATINNTATGTITGVLSAFNTGNFTVNNAGTINLAAGSVLGAGANIVTNSSGGVLNLAGVTDFGAGTDSLTNASGGTVTVAAGTSLTGLETLNNVGTLTAASGLTFDGGATALTNTGTINLTGALDLGAGTDSFANTGAGILNLTGNSSLVGVETLTQSGRINLNTFTLTGTGAFNNTGTIDTNGNAGLLGFTTLSNAGTLDLAAGTFTVPAVVFTNTGTILADEGAATITGQTSFANSGTLDLQDGVVGDVLTINSGFAGSGGSNLLIDFNDTTGDRLVIAGAASGATTVNANFLGGGLINLDGVLVVDTVSTAANAFVLGTVGGDTPLVDFSLVQSGTDFLLVSAPSEAAFNPLAVPGFATSLWYQSADEIFAETIKPATTVGASFWGEGYISRDKFDNDDDSVVLDGVEFDVDNRHKTKRRGIQLGVDYGFDGARIGVSGGYAWAKSNNRADADLKATGWNLGVYGQFGGLTGFHGEFLAKHDRYNAEFNDGVFDGEEFDIRSNGIDGSLGYRFGMGGAATVDVHAGLSHVRTKVDDISLFGFDYDFDKLTSTRGRAGVRAIFGGAIAPFVAGTVYREFSGDGDVELFDGGSEFDLDTEGRATWFRIEAGLSGNNGPGPILAAWGDFGDRKGLGLRAGWRFGGGRVVEVAPPPPVYVAPPAPPPPATQTCPDGSVILATDMCPPAPEPYVPPPPPPAEPERG